MALRSQRDLEASTASRRVSGVPSSEDYYEIEDEQLKSLLREKGDLIAKDLPSRFGFCLLLFTFEPGATFYISNAERSTMVVALQEFIRSNKARGY